MTRAEIIQDIISGIVMAAFIAATYIALVAISTP